MCCILLVIKTLLMKNVNKSFRKKLDGLRSKFSSPGMNCLVRQTEKLLRKLKTTKLSAIQQMIKLLQTPASRLSSICLQHPNKLASSHNVNIIAHITQFDQFESQSRSANYFSLAEEITNRKSFRLLHRPPRHLHSALVLRSVCLSAAEID